MWPVEGSARSAFVGTLLLLGFGATYPQRPLVEIAGASVSQNSARTYSYTGSDPDGWISSMIDRPSAAGAPDYSTFIGGAMEYRVAGIVSDPAGNTFVTGSRMFDLPDVFVTKLDPSGNVVFTATMGGKGFDEVKTIALDPAGNIYIAGSTGSPNFPLRNALQSDISGFGCGFLVKLSPDGSRLIYSTYFGGTRGRSSVNAVAADSNGNVYLTGTTSSADFPHTAGLPVGGSSPSNPPAASGAFVAKVSPAGDRVLYAGSISGGTVSCSGGSSCFLSARFASGNAIAVDAAGNAYIAGNTNTTDLPTTPGAFLRSGFGAFVAKVNAAGSALAYLTYLGSWRYVSQVFATAGNTVNALAVDAAGNAYLTGSTTDPRFPSTPTAFQRTFSGPANPPPLPPEPASDAFVAKLSPDGGSLVWASYLGGTAADSARSIALDPSGNVWVAGTTLSPGFPNGNGWSQGGDFLVGINPAGSALSYSARFPDGTASQSVAVDPGGLVHLAGLNGIVSALVPGQPPTMRIFGIGNAAGGTVAGRVAPGEVISIYGPSIGPSAPATAEIDSLGRIAKSLAGVQVLFDDVPAPLLYVSSQQVNAVVPFAIAARKSARVRLFFGGSPSPDFVAGVVPFAPEIFRNPDGSAAAVNEDGSLNSAERPAKSGSVVAIWATGTGAIDAADGQVAASARDYSCCLVLAPSLPAEVLYAGSSPGIVVGVTQINFRLPTRVDPGIRTIFVRVRTRDSTSAAVGVRVMP